MTVATTTALGLFRSLPKAERAVEALRRAGFRDEQLGLILREQGLSAGCAAVTAKPADPRQYVAAVEILGAPEGEASSAGWLVDAA
jgi:hypothetical protein